jgi:hypothetical protein
MFETKASVPRLTRRQFFQVGTVGVWGFYLQPFLKPLNVYASAKVSTRNTAEYCLFLNLSGGCSHVDSFDIKEGSWTPQDFDVRTIKPGIRMPYGLFPKLSGMLNELVLVRSMRSWENEHIRAQYYLQVAHQTSPARNKEMPSLGSVIAYEYENRRRATDFLPPFVAANFTSGPFRVIGEGCLDAKCSPLTLEISDRGFDFVVPEDEKARFQRRWDLLQKFDTPQPAQSVAADRYYREFDAYYQGAYAMMKAPELAKILKVTEEEHRRYGGSRLGDACVLARNLLRAEKGTRFVALASEAGSWDMHRKIYDKEAMYKQSHELDNALGTLLKDLSQTTTQDGRSMLEKTFVCCLGEFGRTPGPLTVNAGRDHYKEAYTGVFAGGGIKGGKMIGATNEQGTEITDPGWHQKRPVYIEDVAVTIYSALGIDWTKKLTTTPSGRFFEYVEDISGTDFISPAEISEFFG